MTAMQKPTIRNIANYLNTTLRVRSIKDASRNGLQVRSGRSGEIGTVGFAVDACMTTFAKAKKRGVDLLVVHHGIKWRPQKDRDLERLREAFLKKNNIALYAVHLPLDLHEEYGNNRQLAGMLGAGNLRRFGRYHGIKIGCAGAFAAGRRMPGIAAEAERKLRTTCCVLPFGKQRIKTIGIVSGGGGDMLLDAVKEGLDCFFVGEADLAVYNAARDHGMNVIAAGHYATETVGVRALMKPLRERFGVRTLFIDDVKHL
jgi:dinuclear metal center YbgI/SA1388 family protein